MLINDPCHHASCRCPDTKQAPGHLPSPCKLYCGYGVTWIISNHLHITLRPSHQPYWREFGKLLVSLLMACWAPQHHTPLGLFLLQGYFCPWCHYLLGAGWDEVKEHFSTHQWFIGWLPKLKVKDGERLLIKAFGECQEYVGIYKHC